MVHAGFRMSCSFRNLLLEALCYAERNNMVYLLVGYFITGSHEIALDEPLHRFADVAGDAVTLRVGTLAGDVEALAEVQDYRLRLLGELILAHLANFSLELIWGTTSNVRGCQNELFNLFGARLVHDPPSDP